MVFIEWFKTTIHSAYLVLQLVITIIVLFLTTYIVRSRGNSTPDFEFAMVVLTVVTIIVFSSKIIFHMYDTYKGNKQ